jgi:hypothetical protein
VIDDALPGWRDPADWPGWRMLLPHIDALASQATPDADTQDTACLLNQAGLVLDDQGQPGGAAGYLQRTLAGCMRVLAPTTPRPRPCAASSPQCADLLSAPARETADIHEAQRKHAASRLQITRWPTQSQTC